MNIRRVAAVTAVNAAIVAGITYGAVAFPASGSTPVAAAPSDSPSSSAPADASPSTSPSPSPSTSPSPSPSTSATPSPSASPTTPPARPGCYGYTSVLDDPAVLRYACTAILAPPQYTDGHADCRLDDYSPSLDYAVCADGYVFTYPSIGVVDDDHSRPGCYAYLSALDPGFGTAGEQTVHYACDPIGALIDHAGCRQDRYSDRLLYDVCSDGYVAVEPTIGRKVNG